MTPTLKTIAGQLTDAELTAIKKDPVGVAPLKEVIRRLLGHIEATKPVLRACETARGALRGVIRVADRKTVEFDAARVALAELEKVGEL